MEGDDGIKHGVVIHDSADGRATRTSPWKGGYQYRLLSLRQPEASSAPKPGRRDVRFHTGIADSDPVQHDLGKPSKLWVSDSLIME